jgi:hypothetical protein
MLKYQILLKPVQRKSSYSLRTDRRRDRQKNGQTFIKIKYAFGNFVNALKILILTRNTADFTKHAFDYFYYKTLSDVKMKESLPSCKESVNFHLF